MTNSTPAIPSSMTADGIALSAFELSRALFRMLVEKGLISTHDACHAVSQAYEKHEKIAEETGAPGNTNASALLRIVLLEFGCPDPELQAPNTPKAEHN